MSGLHVAAELRSPIVGREDGADLLDLAAPPRAGRLHPSISKRLSSSGGASPNHEPQKVGTRTNCLLGEALGIAHSIELFISPVSWENCADISLVRANALHVYRYPGSQRRISLAFGGQPRCQSGFTTSRSPCSCSYFYYPESRSEPRGAENSGMPNSM